ncbi:T9SS type A sorting domain-containing protein [Flavilitoribacter nigricans]|uniref:Secretion system C-terminal sorting domain-containing protein n=1 Tax=Flavilitoribacter nigricans (strain ATCC 23147 / DSM 23189 / NBRC 102662 / NCIMB 1420 / SS-2) TaxID=1122177 RepID=A0A2D0N504_FLAN2|nr:T9SS type A sorting domain-containing protein [Flavilitoribacter nigricans]PHN03466.1 hypothetical protein CRP01_26035 [Flavilitoribacter nigricans DSM 23189 = NBRC 102662]
MKQFLFFVLCILYTPFLLQAADYFWVGGTGDWSDTGHWATSSGGSTFHASPPGAGDNVYFDAKSFPASNPVVTVDGSPSSCRSMIWTGAGNKPTLIIGTTAQLDIYGDLLLIPGMTLTFAQPTSSRIRMQGNGTGYGITTAGHDLVNFRFEGSGEWTLQDDLTSTSEIIISGGTFISDGFTISAYSLLINGSGIKFDLSNSQVDLTILRIISLTSATLNNSVMTANSVTIFPSGINFNSLELIGSTPGLSGSGLSFATLLLSGTTRTSVTGNHSVQTTLTATQPGSVVEFGSSSTLTLNGSMQSMGSSCSNQITWRSSSSGNAFTIAKSSGSVTIENAILRDVHAAGGATFTANNSIDLGNTGGWLFSSVAPQTYYWIADWGGNWSDGANWSTTSGGMASGCVPSPVDNVVFDDNSFNSTLLLNPVVTVDGNLQQARSMTWEPDVDRNPILRIPALTQLEIYGDLRLTAAVSIDFQSNTSSQIYMKANEAVMIETAGKDLKNFRIDGPEGSFLLLDALTSSYELFLTNGELDLNDFDLQARDLLISNGVLDMSNSDVTATAQFRVNNIASLFAANSTLTTQTLQSFESSLVFGDVIISGTGGLLSGFDLTFDDLTILSSGLTQITGGHTVNGTLSLSNSGGEISFQSGTVTRIADLASSGADCGGQISLRSSTGGSRFTFDFTGPSLPLPADNTNLIIQDSEVLNGPIEVNASIDQGNNSGWTINAAAGKQLFWIGGSGDWDDPAHWSLTSNGGSAGCIPSVSDDVLFDANSFSAAAQEVRVPTGNHHCRNMEWISTGPDAIAYQPTLRLGILANLYVHGSLQLATAAQMSYTVDALSSSKLYVAARTPGHSITSGGLDLINFRMDGAGGEWTLLDDLTASFECFLTSGTLHTDGFDLSGGQFVMSAINTGLNLSDSRIEMTSMILNSTNVDAGTSLLRTTSLNAPGSGLALYDLQLIGTDPSLSTFNLSVQNLQLAGSNQNTVSGNVLVQGDFEMDYPGSTVILGSAYTLEVGGDILNSALPGNRINIRSSTPGSPALLRKTSGNVCLEYLNIRDSNAGGGAKFGVVNSTDEGNNSGWIFSAEASCEIFLPVECMDFRADVREDSGVQLEWTTASERLNRGFRLQRSLFDGPFETIAWIDGSGNTDQLRSYTFFDDQLPPASGGTIYYRLLQIDEDGTLNQACDLVSIEHSPAPFSTLQVYPNPATHSFTLDWQQTSDGPITITVFDALGRVWKSYVLDREAGRQSRTQTVDNWPTGYYGIQLQFPDGRVQSRRLVIAR